MRRQQSLFYHTGPLIKKRSPSGCCAAASISLTPATDRPDKSRPSASLCKWWESLSKHCHQLEALYSPLCLTRQGFPNATSTNIDSCWTNPSTSCLVSQLWMLTLNSPFIIFSGPRWRCHLRGASPPSRRCSWIVPLAHSSMAARTFLVFVVQPGTPPSHQNRPPPPPPLRARPLCTMSLILSTCCPLAARLACVSSIFYTISTRALYATAL